MVVVVVVVMTVIVVILFSALLQRPGRNVSGFALAESTIDVFVPSVSLYRALMYHERCKMKKQHKCIAARTPQHLLLTVRTP